MKTSELTDRAHVSAVLDGAQNAVNKMRRAHKRGTGCHLTAEEIFSLSLTHIGEAWEEDDPRDAAEVR
jgi:hypothetical protein